MEDQLVLYVDHLIAPQTVEKVQGGERSASSIVKEENIVSEEDVPLIQLVECRICQEEDQIKNLEIPCSCSGSLKKQMFLVLISLVKKPLISGDSFFK